MTAAVKQRCEIRGLRGGARVQTVLLLGTRDGLKGVTQREVAPGGGNPFFFP